MKIQDLKKGDKLYCIKTLTKFDAMPNEERKIFLNGRFVKDLPTKEKTQYRKIPSVKKTEYKTLVNGNIYTVLSKISDEITVSTEDKFITIKENILDNYNFIENELFLNEYFISFIEGRKLKLQELSDNNFNSFLKKIKK